MAASDVKASDWASVAPTYTISLDHVAFDKDNERLLYHLALDLTTALPRETMTSHGKVKPDQYLCLSWPIGGLWKIESVSKDRTKVKCLSWRNAHVTSEQIYQQKLEAYVLSKTKRVEDVGGGGRLSRSASLPSLGEAHTVPTPFKWKMVQGSWSTDAHHWFLHPLEMPSANEPHQRRLLVKLFAGFAALEAQIEVHSVTTVDTVAQTYGADITWQATLPAVTTIKDLATLLEFMSILEIDMTQFQFSNVMELKQEHDLSTSVTDAGMVSFHDNVPAGAPWPHVQRVPVFHLQFSRRVTAVFTDEMRLHTFPFDQQKLRFELTTGASGLPDGPLRLIPTPARPGCFAVDNFHLGNVYTLAFHDKVFIDSVVEIGPRKAVTFEIVLERRGMYYVTNVALISAVITYLCFFVTWVPADKLGNAMETGTRLQNATAMVLTAVTFKNQVSSLVPQISYFTLLDSYVTICFMVTCFVTLESALFPLFEAWFDEEWSETTLLGYGLLLFTAVNIGWGVLILNWMYHRQRATVPVMQVYEYIGTIANLVPAADRELVVGEFLDHRKVKHSCRPQCLVTSNGEMHVQAPSDIPHCALITNCIVRGARRRTAVRKADREQLIANQKIMAENAAPEISDLYRALRSRTNSVTSQQQQAGLDDAYSIPAAKTTDAAYQAGTRQLARSTSSTCHLGTGEDRGRAETNNNGRGPRRTLKSVVRTHMSDDLL